MPQFQPKENIKKYFTSHLFQYIHFFHTHQCTQSETDDHYNLLALPIYHHTDANNYKQPKSSQSSLQDKYD